MSAIATIIRGSLRVRLVFALALLCFTLPAAAQDAQEITPSERVTRNVVVRKDSDGDSTAIGKLLPGETATVEGEVPGWYRVRLDDGTLGYVSKAWTIPAGDKAASPLLAQGYKVHVIDVGTGLSVFVEGPGFTLLYDGGTQDDLAMGSNNRILAYLAKVRPDLRVIDHLILSHPHKDHLELLPDVFDKYQVNNVWESGRVNLTAGYCLFLKKVTTEPGLLYHDAIASNAVRDVTFPSSGCNQTIRVKQSTQMTDAPVRLGPGAQMTFLYRDAHPYSDPNGNSVVVRLDFGNRSILLAGDAEGGDRDPPTTAPRPNSIEGRLLVCCRTQLKADVLIVGHHGSLTSSRVPFLDAVQATIFVISSGPFPYQGNILPDDDVVKELKTRGTLFQTNENDPACRTNRAKIGPDADNRPGGCNNVQIRITPNGQINADYFTQAD